MLNPDTRLRVFNRALYDIGVVQLNGVSFNIKPNSFQILSVQDIAFIEMTFVSKFFSRGLLEAVDENGKVVTLSELGLVADESVKHYSEEEIRKALSKSVKSIEEWMEGIKDEAEKHAIYVVAEKMDLPQTKIKALIKFMPNKDWLGQLEDE